MQQERAVLLRQNIRRPAAAQPFRPHGNQPLLCPVHQILRLPQGQKMAPLAANLIPGAVILASHAIAQGKIRRENIELFAIGGSRYRMIAHPLIPVIRPEHRTASIHLLPVKGVAAQSKIHLLPVRSGFFSEMNKQIRHRYECSPFHYPPHWRAVFFSIPSP